MTQSDAPSVAPTPTPANGRSNNRVEQLLHQLDQREGDERVEALLITHLKDVRYLSEFRVDHTGGSGALIITPDERVLITDFRYRTDAQHQAPDWTYVEVPTGKQLVVIAGEALKERKLRRIGAQADHISHSDWQQLGETLEIGDGLVAVKGAVDNLRSVKDADELACMKKAARLADETMLHAFQIAEIGLSERNLKAELDHYMVTHGADSPAFDMIVAGGPNSALPHARAGERPLQHGDLLTLDMGAMVDGYCSDLTRTIVLGEPNDEQRVLYELVYQAQLAALKALRAGVTGKAVDEVARQVISDAGHGDHFGHGLGHGVGLNIHEPPRLNATNETELQAGQVVTVEPGVYLAGVGGVRIEDMVVITEHGCESLSHAPKPTELMSV